MTQAWSPVLTWVRWVMVHKQRAEAEVDESQVGKRLVYGGHVISVCRALAYVGLENVLGILAVNCGTHAAPTVAGDTLYAYSEVIGKWQLPGRADVGAVRLRLVGLKNAPPGVVAGTRIEGSAAPGYHPAVVLGLDYTVLMPRKQSDGGRHE